MYRMVHLLHFTTSVDFTHINRYVTVDIKSATKGSVSRNVYERVLYRWIDRKMYRLL